MKPPLRHLLLLTLFIVVCYGQDYDDGGGDEVKPAAPPPAQEDCNGIFLSYTFISREKELPKVKNVSAQAWVFKSVATILNAGSKELKSWKMYIGFQHDEILVSVDGAVLMDGGDFPVAVGNGTYLSGTMFGLRPKAIPMPKTIRLENDGYKCLAPRRHGTSAMYVCCKRDPKLKLKNTKKIKFLPRQNGDLSFSYDVLQAYGGSYLAHVTIDNNNPLGRLDHWNLTWEWMRGEFIYTMRGAYTHRKDPLECIYGPTGNYYKDLDFSQVMNCQKKPIISDLPAEKAEDEK
ncbi:hypothetical protein UlMin_003499, partial [Ulmus minor]